MRNTTLQNQFDTAGVGTTIHQYWIQTWVKNPNSTADWSWHQDAPTDWKKQLLLEDNGHLFPLTKRNKEEQSYYLKDSKCALFLNRRIPGSLPRWGNMLQFLVDFQTFEFLPQDFPLTKRPQRKKTTIIESSSWLVKETTLPKIKK